jgi:hypothetical protein
MSKIIFLKEQEGFHRDCQFPFLPLAKSKQRTKIKKLAELPRSNLPDRPYLNYKSKQRKEKSSDIKKSKERVE